MGAKLAKSLPFATANSGFRHAPPHDTRQRKREGIMIGGMLWVRVGAIFCFLAVGLGAFGAHALKETLAAHQSREIWQTAVLYHFLHGLALILFGFHQVNRIGCHLIIVGIILFSGSLYGLALTSARWLGPITPLGGLCFLAGWLVIAIARKG